MIKTKQDFRVVHPDKSKSYCIDIANAEALQAKHGGTIQCYVYGIGWVKWCEAMR
jgi:hypothetical protein